MAPITGLTTGGRTVVPGFVVPVGGSVRPCRSQCRSSIVCRRFERVVVRIAQQTYGRASAVLRNAGAYVCRPVRSSTVQRWSEHAFGNAVDVVGFDFSAD